MNANLAALLVGLTVVVDTALLATFVERRNWRQVMLPIVLAALGAWLLHGGMFTAWLLADLTADGAPWLRWLAMLATAAGALLMPCAITHGALRFARQGLQTGGRPNWGYTLAYGPLLLLLPVGWQLAHSNQATLLMRLENWIAPYVGMVSIVNVFSAALLWANRQRVTHTGRTFARQVAAVLLAMTVWQAFVFLYAASEWPAGGSAWTLSAVLSPAALVLLFAYYVLRHNLMQIVLERTIVYGAILVGALLFHRLAVERASDALSEQYRVDVGLLEGLVAVVLVLAWPPLRKRASEALRYLLGSRVDLIRRAARSLSMELAQRAGESPESLLTWFCQRAPEALELEAMRGYLFDAQGDVILQAGALTTPALDLPGALQRELLAQPAPWATRRDASGALAQRLLMGGPAALVVAFDTGRISGLLVFGTPRREDLSEEEASAIVVLTEQLSVALSAGLLAQERFDAERRALENDKLSTMGLLASTMAHEIKNPLSAIKTIAAVLAEQLGPESEHAEDLQLILGEIDRLANTTSELLEFARPAPLAGGSGSPAVAISATLRLLGHLARQQNVTLTTQLDDVLPATRAAPGALREVLFNLVSNAIESTGAGGNVNLICTRDADALRTEVRDDGPGIADEVRKRMFDPFVTTRPGGSGLGLHIVARRVRESGGTIDCQSQPGGPTTFCVRLPIVS